jgi:peptide deformylase
MAIRKIASVGHPVLRQPARRLSRDELAGAAAQRLIDDLVDTLRDARAAGLAANQIHEPVQICAIEIPSNPRYSYVPGVPLTILVNPVIEPIGDERYPNYEGCLSVPDLRGIVPRACEIRVRAWDRGGGELDFVARGLAAGAYQHEVDHLCGGLYLDRVRDPASYTTGVEYDRHHAAASAARARAMIERFGS